MMQQIPKRQAVLCLVVGVSLLWNLYASVQLLLPNGTFNDKVSGADLLNIPQVPCPEVGWKAGSGVVDNTTQLVSSVPRLFHCGGYALNRNFQPTLQSVLPEYRWQDIRSVEDFKSTDMLTTHPWDIFVSNYQLDECPQPAFFPWLQLHFAGTVVFWTPEDATNYIPVVHRPNHVLLGPGSPVVTVTFLQTAFWAQVPFDQKRRIAAGSTTTSGTANIPRQREVSPVAREHFLIYANSRCVGERQTAFRQIANAGFPTVHYGGRCDGGVKKNQTKAMRFPNKVGLANWQDNLHMYRQFRFCLTMEHVDTPGYITEKILVAFWAGCIPIYWGTKEIFSLFNRDAFIYWDVDDPQMALDRIQYLESNRSAYEQVAELPILSPGALESYFSFDDGFGGGALKKRIRNYIGLANYRFSR